MEAHGRYLEIEDGRLADELVDAAEAAVEFILRWPEAPPPYRGRQSDPMIRTWHLGKFPYNLVYMVSDGKVFVLAYAHESRRPDYWSYRVRG